MSLGRSRPRLSCLAVSVASILILTACGGDDDQGTTPSNGASGEASDGEPEPDEGSGETVELSFAHSYATSHPHHECGAQVVADELAGNGSGLEIDIFPGSQLGPDGPERVTSVASGDISIDIQGSSAISALYEPIGALDAAYVFDGPDHLFEFADSPAFDQLRDDMLEATGIRILDVWYFGMRQFTANQPIRTPDDLQGLRMRFPESPQFLQNAEAMGASATPVAFEEVYLSLQQGVIDGQENPIPTIAELNLPEVQSHVSLSAHQTGFVVAIVGEDTWQSLSAEQQEALHAAVSGAREGNRECLEGAEQEVLDEWEAGGQVTVVDDVDRTAFSEQTEAFFEAELDGEKLALYQSIRELAN